MWVPTGPTDILNDVSSRASSPLVSPMVSRARTAALAERHMRKSASLPGLQGLQEPCLYMQGRRQPPRPSAPVAAPLQPWQRWPKTPDGWLRYPSAEFELRARQIDACVKDWHHCAAAARQAPLPPTGSPARHRALDDIRERMRFHEVRAYSPYTVSRSGDGL